MRTSGMIWAVDATTDTDWVRSADDAALEIFANPEFRLHAQGSRMLDTQTVDFHQESGSGLKRGRPSLALIRSGRHSSQENPGSPWRDGEAKSCFDKQ